MNRSPHSPRRGPRGNTGPAKQAQHLVVALAYDGLCTFEFGCTVEFFALERPELGVPWYRFEVCAYERSPIRAMGGIRVVVPRSFRGSIAPIRSSSPAGDVDDLPPPALLRTLRRGYERGARL